MSEVVVGGGEVTFRGLHPQTGDEIIITGWVRDFSIVTEDGQFATFAEDNSTIKTSDRKFGLEFVPDSAGRAYVMKIYSSEDEATEPVEEDNAIQDDQYSEYYYGYLAGFEEGVEALRKELSYKIMSVLNTDVIKER